MEYILPRSASDHTPSLTDKGYSFKTCRGGQNPQVRQFTEEQPKS